MKQDHESRSRFYTILGIALAMFLGALDQTIVSTAMPRIVAELHGLERFTWVTTAYLLVSTLLVPIYGKLADIVSRRLLEIASVSVFLAASALCGLAGEWGSLPLIGDGMNQLILFRALQGLGGAGIFALAFIIVSDLYPPRERGKISGVFGAVFGLSSILGPLVGGFLTDNAGAWLPPIEGWRWVFYVNIPIGLVALWFIVTKMPHLHPAHAGHGERHELDLLSAGLMVGAFAPLILALQLDKTAYPWGSWQILGLLGVSAVFLASWIIHSLRTKHPILDLRLYANKVFAWSSVATFFFGGGFMSVIIFLPIYMVFAQGVSATGAGVSIIPLSMGSVLGSTLSGAIITRTGRYKSMMVVGAIIAIASFVMLSGLGTATPYWLVVVCMFVVGLGFGPSQSVYALASQNSVPPAKIGQTTSAIQFSRQMGAVVMAAILGVVFNTTLTEALPKHGIDGTMSSLSGGGKAGLGAGPEEIRAGIISGFDAMEASLDRLFSLRGPEAKLALDSFLADPKVPAEYRDRLRAGTPSMRIDAAFDALLTAVEAGDSVTLAELLDPEKKDADGNPGLGASMPDFASATLQKLAVAPEAQRQARMPAIRSQFEAQKTSIEETASVAAGKAVHDALEAAKVSVADRTVEGLKASFSDGAVRVWFYGIFLMVGLFLACLMIPDLPLHGKKEGPPAGVAGPPAAEHPEPALS
ncbi:MAG: MDR family MFS transporter [Rectinemataceae bacterium]